MSTTPVVASPGFDWKSLLTVIELAGNTAVSILIPGGVALAPLLVGLETAVNPLLQSIGTKPSVSSEIMNVYGTIIGILTTLKQTPGLPQATLSKVDEYLTAAQNGTAAYLQAGLGFDPSNYAPVTPIV
jgi:hypothetical protein